MKKKFLIMGTSACILAIIIGGSIYAALNWDFSERAQASNKVVGEQTTLASEDYIATINGEGIEQSRFDSYKAGLQNTGNEFSDQEILDLLIKRTVVMQEAENQGFSVTDSEIDTFVDETLKIINNDPQVLGIIEQYNQNAGITLDNYKERIRVICKKAIIVNKFKENMLNQFPNVWHLRFYNLRHPLDDF